MQITSENVVVPAVNRNVLLAKLQGWISTDEKFMNHRMSLILKRMTSLTHLWVVDREKGAILEPLNYLDM